MTRIIEKPLGGTSGSAWELEGTGIVFTNAHKTEPKTVNAVVAGNVLCDPGHLTYPIALADLTLITAVQYNGDTDVRYPGPDEAVRTGVQSNVQYAVFSYQGRFTKPQVVIGRMSGFGPQFYLADNYQATDSLLGLIALPGVTGRMVWDLCDTLVGSHEKGYKEGRKHEYQRLGRAFLEGRLKKRRRQGSVRLHIDEPIPRDEDGSFVIQVGGQPPGVPCVAE